MPKIIYYPPSDFCIAQAFWAFLMLITGLPFTEHPLVDRSASAASLLCSPSSEPKRNSPQSFSGLPSVTAWGWVISPKQFKLVNSVLKTKTSTATQKFTPVSGSSVTHGALPRTVHRATAPLLASWSSALLTLPSFSLLAHALF